MTLVIKKPTSGKLVMAKAPGNGLDADAAAYIAAVEAADGQPLEAGVRWNIDQFVRGCKADGIWSAIKTSCILAGARTLAGALVPLVGTAPTNVNFVAGDYDRKTGLVGNGSTKYLNANRNNNADPQNNKHLSVWASSSGANTSSWNTYMGAIPVNGVGRSDIELTGSSGTINFFANSNNAATSRSRLGATGLFAVSRNGSSSQITRLGGLSASGAAASTTPFNGNILVFARSLDGVPNQHINARLAFYSIGEALDLALLDSRVTTLINCNASVIP